MADEAKSMKRAGKQQEQTPSADKQHNDTATSEAPNELARHAGSKLPAGQGDVEPGDGEKTRGS